MQAGKRHTEESKVLIRAVRAKQPSAIIGRYGITVEIFDCEIAAGIFGANPAKSFLILNYSVPELASVRRVIERRPLNIELIALRQQRDGKTKTRGHGE